MWRTWSQEYSLALFLLICSINLEQLFGFSLKNFGCRLSAPRDITRMEILSDPKNFNFLLPYYTNPQPIHMERSASRCNLRINFWLGNIEFFQHAQSVRYVRNINSLKRVMLCSLKHCLLMKSLDLPNEHCSQNWCCSTALPHLINNVRWYFGRNELSAFEKECNNQLPFLPSLVPGIIYFFRQ